MKVVVAATLLTIARCTSSFAVPPVAVQSSASQQQTRQQDEISYSTTTTSRDMSFFDVSKYMTGDRPDGTSEYVMQQTMIRVKDPEKSLDFYCNVLGFKLVMYKEFPKWGFNGKKKKTTCEQDSFIPEGIRYDLCI